MAQTLRFGMVGAGEIAVQTAQGIAEAENATIVAVMDTNEAVARDLAERHGAEWTTDLDALLQRSDIDAVYIAVPHYLHAPLTIRAAEAGKHVLCEKPIATTLADADRMIAACRQAGVALSIAYHAQVDAGCQAARRFIQEGGIGRVYGTRLFALSDKPATYWHGGYTQRVHTDWRISKEKAGGGILIMNLIHDLNTVRFVTGLEAQRVYSEYGTFCTPVEVEDFLVATIRYHGGAIGSIEAGSAIRGRGRGIEPGSRIYGTEGQVILGRKPLVFTTRELPGITPNEWQELPFDGPSGSRRQMVEQFAAAVLAGRTPPVTGEDGRAALAIVVAAYQSGAEGRPIEVAGLA